MVKGRSNERIRAAAVCAPGLESVCEAELRALNLRPKTAGPGTIEFDTNPRGLYAANVWLRSASRVMVRVATFRATDFRHLEEHASQVPWSELVPRGFAPKFRISTTDSKLYHTKAIAERFHQVSFPPSTGGPEQLFIVRINRNTVTLSIDSSGEALHRRPWRTEIGAAPLRPNLAAALVLASGWSPAVGGLSDPFCGSGTIGIEAALLALGMPPGGEREFAFQSWRDFEPGSWASVVATIASSQERAAAVLAEATATATSPLIVLSDRDETAIATTKANAERAGVAELVEAAPIVVSHLKARQGAGMVITNPPYGRRLGKAEMSGLYGRLGSVVRERLPGYGMALVTSEAKLASATDGRLRSSHRFKTGGLKVQLFQRPLPQSLTQGP